MKNKILSITILLLTSVLFLTISVNAQDTLKAAPGFTLKDINGKTVSLSDFQGKTIYLDIWASWCGPCIREISYSRKLQKKFAENPNIVFINISFDDDTIKWKNTIKKRKMQGIQLISIKGGESEVKTNYNVKSIPRFIIINKNGKLVDKFAPPPSDTGIEAYLNEVINL